MIDLSPINRPVPDDAVPADFHGDETQCTVLYKGDPADVLGRLVSDGQRFLRAGNVTLANFGQVKSGSLLLKLTFETDAAVMRLNIRLTPPGRWGSTYGAVLPNEIQAAIASQHVWCIGFDTDWRVLPNSVASNTPAILDIVFVLRQVPQAWGVITGGNSGRLYALQPGFLADVLTVKLDGRFAVFEGLGNTDHALASRASRRLAFEADPRLTDQFMVFDDPPADVYEPIVLLGPTEDEVVEVASEDCAVMVDRASQALAALKATLYLA